MAYEHEREESRSAEYAMTEMQRAVAENEVRRHMGVIGDPEDAVDG